VFYFYFYAHVLPRGVASIFRLQDRTILQTDITSSLPLRRAAIVCSKKHLRAISWAIR
jgi:hypothetical protein